MASLFIGSIQLLSKAANALSFFCRVVHTADQTMQIKEKVETFDPATWEKKDYIETAMRATCVVTDGLAIYSEWDGVQLGRKISDLTKKIEDGKENVEALKKGLVATKEKLSQVEKAAAVFSVTGAGSYVAAEVASDTPVTEALSSTHVLSRIGSALESAGSAYADQYPKLASMAGWTGRRMKNHFLGKGASTIWANFCYQNYQADVRQHNQGLPPGQVWLTVPPRNHNYQMIPAIHDADPVFSQYQCPITGGVIRYPVAIQANNGAVHHYELAAIYTWVQARGTNPLTQGPLGLGDLRADLAVQTAIENRMRHLNIPLQ